jgi:uncharacterized protein DUF6353
MKFLDSVRTAVTSTAGRQILQAQKHSPQILFATGVVGLTATVVMACRATLKSTDIIEEHSQMMKRIETLEDAKYSEEDRNHDKTLLVIKTSVKIGRAFLPVAALGVLTVASFTSSHVILTRRNSALMAAYATLDKGFREYRARVRDELGDEKDREFQYGIRKGRVQQMDEKGDITHVKAEHYAVPSIYARFFDETCKAWVRNVHYNKAFLLAQQNFANDLLHSRGHVFLNEVYDILGFEHTQAGAVVGWVLGNGDDFISFGCFDGDRERSRAFVNGLEPSVMLDFNVDGVVYNLLGK